MSRKLKASGPVTSLEEAGKQLFEFGLGSETLVEIKVLAREAECTPFQMCLILLQEEMSRKAAKKTKSSRGGH